MRKSDNPRHNVLSFRATNDEAEAIAKVREMLGVPTTDLAIRALVTYGLNTWRQANGLQRA